MPLKKFRPMTPALRHTQLPDFSELTRARPIKSLTERKLRTGGRDNYGHVSQRWISGGHKQRYRLIDFRRNKDGVPARVASIEYDPNRSARIALLNYFDGERRYILAPDGLKVGDVLQSGAAAEIRARQLSPAPQHSARHQSAQRRAVSGTRVARRPFGRRLLPADGEGRRLRAAATALG
jgi:large subunit ribosomal protein L2